MADTPSNTIPYSPEGVVDPAAGLNDALRVIDVLLQLRIVSIANTLPTGVTDGNRYLVGTSPTGVAVGHAGQIARYVATGAFYTFHNANYAILGSTLYVNNGSNVWAASAGGGITSVNGDAGPAVVLDATDVGAEPVIAGGTSAQFWNGSKVWTDFATTVRGTVLTGYVAGAMTAIAATDTVLQAFAKVGAYLAALGTAAFKNTGTSGNTVPLLDGANTFSAQLSVLSAAPAMVVGSAHTNVAPAAAMSVGYDDNLVTEFISCSAVAPAYSPKFNILRGRGTMASPGALVGNDSLGAVQFLGAVSGGTFTTGASISVSVEGTPSASFNPASIYFATSDGVTGNTGRWILGPTGAWRPIVSNAYDIGTASLRVRKIYSVEGDFSGPLKPGTYTLSTLPSAAANTGAQIYVSNMTGGAEGAFSNGTNWCRNSDRTTAS